MQAQIHAPRVGYAYNLLDNSDFRNPVNQRGQTSYTGNQYTIDRWRTYSVGATVSVANGYVGINDALMQYVLGIDTTKIYTAAVARPDGSLSVTSGTFGAGFGNVSIGIRCGVSSNLARFLIEGAVFPQIAWAALYEGEYTADTLPPYQPKGYGAELAECRRYFIRTTGNAIFVGAGSEDTSTVRCYIPTGGPMRMTVPSVSPASGLSVSVRVHTGAYNATDATAAVASTDSNGVLLRLTSANQIINGQYALAAVCINTPLSISADL